MKFVIALAAVAALVPVASAHADDNGQFQSPSGNILCGVGTIGPDGKATVTCEIRAHSYTPPPKPENCHLGWGDRISLDQGGTPVVHCHGDTIFGAVPPPPSLPYGQSRSAGTIGCVSQPSGVTCTDRSTGHYFRVSREALDLG